MKTKHLPFNVDKAEKSPGFLLWQVSTTWQRQIKKVVEQQGVSHAQFVILAVMLWLEMHEEMITQTTLIHWTKLDKMTISQSLKKLTQEKLILRTESHFDTRAKEVQLTKKGIAFASELVPQVETVDTAFFGALTKQEQKQLLSLLQRLL